MCGRYTLYQLAQFTDLFPWIRPPDSPPPGRYNIAPTNAVAVVANEGEPKIDFFHWGLIPSWAKDPSIGSRMINARGETLMEKPAFRNALRRRRCLIPADGFYEWKKSPDGKTKTPMYIRMKDGRPFAFAGLWEVWHSADGSVVPSCTIITTSPNEVAREIHDRMPVIVRPGAYRLWLTPGEVEPAEVQGVLSAYPAEEMEAYAVSRAVNRAAHDAPDCIEGITAAEGEGPGPGRRKGRKRASDEDQPGLF